MRANISISLGKENASQMPNDFTSLKYFLTFILHIFQKLTLQISSIQCYYDS